MPETNQTASSLADLLKAVGGLVVATTLSAPVAGAITALITVSSNLLTAEASGGVTQEQWDAAHAETADILAKINARR